MFQQDAKESLHASQKRAMDHKRPMLGAVFSDVSQIEPLRQIEVELNRTQLPWPPDSIVDQQVDLRAVKGAVTGIDLVLDARSFERVFQCNFSRLPIFFPP